MKKKWISLIMIITTINLILSACSSVNGNANSEAGKKVTITFWKAPHSSDEAKLWQPIIKQFEAKYPNIQVDLKVTPWDTYQQQYTAAFAGDSPPDVSYQTDWVVNFAKQGKLQDLSSYFTKEKQSSYSPGAINYGTIDGKLIGVPFIALDTMVFYNKTIFKEKNIQIPQTWDEYIAAAKKATYGGDHYGIGFITHPMDYWQPLSFIYQAGDSLYNADMTKANFNNTEGIKGLQFFYDLYNKYKVVPPVDLFSSAEQMNDAFFKGKIAMMPAQIQFSSEIKTNAPTLDYGVFQMPAGPSQDSAKQRWNYSGMGLLSIAQASKHKKEAWEFINFITQPDIEKLYLEKVGFFSPQMATNKLMYQDNPVMQEAAKSIENMQILPENNNNGKVLTTVLQPMFESLARGYTTPKQAAKDATEKINTILSSSN